MAIRETIDCNEAMVTSENKANQPEGNDNKANQTEGNDSEADQSEAEHSEAEQSEAARQVDAMVNEMRRNDELRALLEPLDDEGIELNIEDEVDIEPFDFSLEVDIDSFDYRLEDELGLGW